MKIDEKPFSKPIGPLTQSVEETVYFPCDDEKNTNAIVSIGWRGPKISDLTDMVAVDLFFSYLTDSSISPVQAHFITDNSYCSIVRNIIHSFKIITFLILTFKVTYDIQEYLETSITIDFSNTLLEHVDKIKKEFFELLNKIIDKRVEFDLKRMHSLIKTKISEIDDKVTSLKYKAQTHYNY